MALLDNINLRNPWVIGGVVVAGAAIAFFVIPKLRGGTTGASASASGGPNENAASQTDAAGGQPIYVIEETQYTPSGASPGSAIGPTPPTGGPSGPNQPVGPGRQPPVPTGSGGPVTLPGRVRPGGPGGRPGPTGPAQPVGNRPPGPGGGPTGPAQPVRPPEPPIPGQGTPPKRFVHPSAWPKRDSTLSQIASDNGVSLSYLQGFPENAYIGQRSGGWNRIYTSDTIRVA